MSCHAMSTVPGSTILHFYVPFHYFYTFYCIFFLHERRLELCDSFSNEFGLGGGNNENEQAHHGIHFT
jgi:hypothetical protein